MASGQMGEEEQGGGEEDAEGSMGVHSAWEMGHRPRLQAGPGGAGCVVRDGEQGWGLAAETG